MIRKLTLTSFAAKTHLNNHYILVSKEKFMVFTYNTVFGIKNNYIHHVNIDGDIKPQYIVEKVHKLDLNQHILTETIQGNNYLNELMQKLSPDISILNHDTTGIIE